MAKHERIRYKKYNDGVYLIRQKDLYKIGVSKNVMSRFDAIYSDIQEPLHLLCVIRTNDMYAVEKYLHDKYTLYRIIGEWFRLTEEIVLELMFTLQIDYNWKDKTFTQRSI